MESLLSLSVGEMELRHSRGSFEWFFEHGSHRSESSDSLSSLLQVEDSVSKVVSSVCHTSPSKHDQVILGESLFGKKRDRATDLGTEVHELFEEIEWLKDDVAVQAFLLEIKEKASETAFEHVRKVLENEDARALFAKPNEPSIVWREQTFSLLSDGELVNGVFDRVVLRQGAAGRWLSAEIIDYKTDNITGAQCPQRAQNYTSQLKLYRHAAQTILAKPVTAAYLYFLQPGVAIPVGYS